jgi:hypothetical protein
MNFVRRIALSTFYRQRDRSISTSFDIRMRRFCSASGIRRTSIIDNLNIKLELHGFRKVWSDAVSDKVNDRLKRPRFGFPGVFDRAPPPPKTLHWKQAPVAGEYFKIKGILSWAVLHVAIIGERLANSQYQFLVSKCMDRLETDLINTWLPEASIPAFSVKGEAKKLSNEYRIIVDDLMKCGSPESMIDILWETGLRDLGIERSDTRLNTLSQYIEDQQSLLKQMDLMDILESPNSWNWLDRI